MSQPNRGIVDVLSTDSSFERFLTAAGPSGAFRTLRGAGPFTGFAFTNSGWAALPIFTTRNGSRVTVDPRNADRIGIESAGGGGQSAGVGSVGLRSSRIQRPDVEAANGIIHVMTGIIIP